MGEDGGDASASDDSDKEKDDMADRKKKLKASKNYRSIFIQKKMAEQSERLKKMRKEGRKPQSSIGGTKRKGKDKTAGEEAADLMEKNEELRLEA